MNVAPEPTDEMIEAALIACGVSPRVIDQTMHSVRRNKGTAHEPAICCQLRACIAIINGVPLTQIKRGYRP